MRKVRSANVFGGVEARRNVWFTLLESKRQEESYD